jgi:hypothetical protein
MHLLPLAGNPLQTAMRSAMLCLCAAERAANAIHAPRK